MDPKYPDPNPKFDTHLLRAYFAICGTGLLLGLIPLFKKWLSGTDCLWIVFFRALVAFISIVVVIAVRKSWIKLKVLSHRHWLYFFGYGFVSITLVSYLYIRSLELTTVAIAVIAVFTAAPLTTLMVELVRFKQKSSPIELIGIVLSIIGCALVNYQGLKFDHDLWGIGCGLAAGFCYGLYPIFGEKLSRHYEYTAMMFWQFAISLGASAIILLLPLGQSVGYLNLRTISGIVSIGLFSTFLPYIFYSYGLKGGAKKVMASTLTILEPVSASFVAYVFLKQGLSRVQIVGALLVLSAATIMLVSIDAVEKKGRERKIK